MPKNSLEDWQIPKDFYKGRMQTLCLKAWLFVKMTRKRSVKMGNKSEKWKVKKKKTLLNKIEVLAWQILGFFARNEHVSPKYLDKSNGKPHPSHLAHPSFLCPPPYHNLFDTLTNNITSLFFVKFNPFHPFNFIIQELHALHGLFNRFVIQPCTTSDYLHV